MALINNFPIYIQQYNEHIWWMRRSKRSLAETFDAYQNEVYNEIQINR